MDVQNRLIRRQDMVACKLAFIDCKMPGSTDKENYSLIGAGVTQSADQVVNITEPHGFSLGVAAMPAGTINNLHVHYTAEVFMVYSGTWKFRWGADGTDGEIIGRAGDVVSIPTWIFRGFVNVGDDAGWIFTALGGDETGGLIWHPSILRTAAEHGMYLTRDNMLVDTTAGAAVPPPEACIVPLDRAAIATLRKFDTAAMRRRTVTAGERAWSGRAMLDSCLPGHASSLAAVVGHGMGQDIEQASLVANPHGFSIEWLRIEPGQRVGAFQLAEKQVLILFSGSLEVSLDGAAPIAMVSQEVFSVPADAWRIFTCVGDVTAEIAVIISGDQKKHPTWDPALIAAAAAKGVGVDLCGYLAPHALLPEVMANAA